MSPLHHDRSRQRVASDALPANLRPFIDARLATPLSGAPATCHSRELP